MDDYGLTHPNYGQVMQEIELLSFSIGINFDGNIEVYIESKEDIDFFEDGFFAVIDINKNEVVDVIEIIHPISGNNYKIPLLAEISGILISRFILKDKIEEETLYVICPFLDMEEISKEV